MQGMGSHHGAMEDGMQQQEETMHSRPHAASSMWSTGALLLAAQCDSPAPPTLLWLYLRSQPVHHHPLQQAGLGHPPRVAHQAAEAVTRPRPLPAAPARRQQVVPLEVITAAAAVAAPVAAHHCRRGPGPGPGPHQLTQLLAQLSFLLQGAVAWLL